LTNANKIPKRRSNDEIRPEESKERQWSSVSDKKYSVSPQLTILQLKDNGKNVKTRWRNSSKKKKSNWQKRRRYAI
jgi:hypothetical protein